MAQDGFNAVLRWTEVACRWSREVYLECYGRKEGNGIASLKAGVQKLRGIGGGMDEGI
jgi:hypothetical protein